MRVSGPISAQRLRPAYGWTAYPRVIVLQATAEPLAIAPTLPPQQRGDAACLTLVMAQTFGEAPRSGGAYAAPLEDETPIFAIRA